MSNSTSEAGFTLVELLVASAVAALVVGLLSTATFQFVTAIESGAGKASTARIPIGPAMKIATPNCTNNFGPGPSAFRSSNKPTMCNTSAQPMMASTCGSVDAIPSRCSKTITGSNYNHAEPSASTDAPTDPWSNHTASVPTKIGPQIEMTNAIPPPRATGVS